MKNSRKYLIIICVLLDICALVFLFMSYYFFSVNKQMIDKLKEREVYDKSGNINFVKLDNEIDESLVKIQDYLEDIDSKEELRKVVAEFESDNLKYESEIVELNGKKETLEETLDNLKKEYDVLNNQYQIILREERERAEAEARKNMIIIDGVPTISQYPNYPTGCESVALTILLRYYEVDVTPDDVISELKKGDLPYYEEDEMFGGNPELEFIGNPYSYDGYGVYNEPIASVANIYKDGVNVRKWMPFSEVLDLVATGRPVVVWTSMYLAVPYVSASWIYKPTGEIINWKANEHAVVVMGYNDNYVVISDPLSGSIQYQPRSVFESRYNYYSQRAVYY